MIIQYMSWIATGQAKPHDWHGKTDATMIDNPDCDWQIDSTWM
jgi:hypothetical protein